MNSYCNNCGKNGHAFHQCKSPITSYGIIAFRENPSNQAREYLLIRRKDTLGFVDFMRGKYSIYNKEYILNMIKQMTNNEKTRILTEPFSKLWGDLWGTPDAFVTGQFLQRSNSEVTSVGLPTREVRGFSASIASIRETKEFCSEDARLIRSVSSPIGSTTLLPRSCFDSGIVSVPNVLEQTEFRKDNNTLERDPYNAEEQTSRNKFESLKSGVYTKNDYYDLEELIGMTERLWDEPEWGFPKGRRNYQEKDYDCAVREFCEETGFNINELVPLKNIQPFEEVFTGSNYKSYKHKYYVTFMKYEDTLSSRNLQVSEVSESRWMTFEKCNEAIRNYNVEKKRVLIAVEKMLSDNYVSHASLTLFGGR